MERATRLESRLKHRGPDAQSHRLFPNAGLVHTRLSIIDLSPAGAQPIGNEDGSVFAVFNGEIYNHQELRRDLESKGHHFRGRSDSEVLPHLYEEYGDDFVGQLRGMFAFAIHDVGRNRILLARDWFGIKPLFFSLTRSELIFASELNAITGEPGIDTRPNPQAISDLAELFYVPAPDTFFRGVSALMPGQRLTAQWSHDQVRAEVRTYHEFELKLDDSLTVESAAQIAGVLLDKAVSAQLESDVPLGAFLSGGIDSSLVSVAARRSLSSLQTFNVGFPEPEFDETWAAVAVAKAANTSHTTLAMSEVEGSWEHVVGLLRHAGQPFADTSLFPSHAISRLIRSRVTVALAGDGGDEAFGGYNTYWQLNRIAQFQRVPSALRNLAIRTFRAASPFAPNAGRLSERAKELSRSDEVEVIRGLYAWMTPSMHAALLAVDGVDSARRLFESKWRWDLPRGSGQLERLSALATECRVRLALPNDYLFKVDTASMRESLEVRVPMLDEDFFTFGLKLPHALKADAHTTKRVLRELAKHRLPKAVSEKPKVGFGIPFDRWVNQEFRSQLSSTLMSPTSPLRDVFRPEYYRPLIDAFGKGSKAPEMSRAGHYGTVVMLLGVHIFLGGSI